MPFTYEDTLQGERRNAVTIPSSRRDVLTEQFAQSFEENPILALKRFSDLAEDQVTGPRLPAETARAKLKDAGMENDLVINEGGITEAALTTLMERKRVEKRRQEIFARSEGGAGELAQRLGVAFATTLVDPLSAGLNFVPIVGQARYVRWLSVARSMGGRLAVRGAVGAAEGAVGAAIAEIPIYAMRTQEQADYDAVDSLLNVAFGGVIGAGLHTTVGTAGELIARRLPARQVPSPRVEPTIGEAPIRTAEPLPADVQRAIFAMGDMERVVDNLSSEVQQAALRAAVGQGVEGRAIDVEPIVRAAAPAELAPVVRTEFAPVLRENVIDAAATKERLPPVADGYTRLYRAESPTVKSADVFDFSTPAMQRHYRKGVPGRYYSSDLKAADYYRATYGRDAKLHFIDVPNAMLAGRQAEFGEFKIDVEAINTEVAEANATRLRTSAQPKPTQPDQDLRAADEHAQTVLARDFEPTTEANLKAAEEEADLAVSEATELTKRLGVDMKEDADFTAVMEGVEKAERWARVAELATVCLVRGG